LTTIHSAFRQRLPAMKTRSRKPKKRGGSLSENVQIRKIDLNLFGFSMQSCSNEASAEQHRREDSITRRKLTK
jgi:hypothetical protein